MNKLDTISDSSGNVFKLDTAATQLAELDRQILEICSWLNTLDGDGWSVVPRENDENVRWNYSASLIHEKGLGLWINRYKDGYTAGAKYRFKVRGDWGKDPNQDSHNNLSLSSCHLIKYGEEEPSITVAEDRPAKAIASAIKGRLIESGGLWDYYGRVQGVVAERAAYEAGKRSTGEALASVLGIEAGSGDKPKFSGYNYCSGWSYGDIRVDSENSVRFEISVDAELAKELALVLAKRREVTG